MKFTALLPLAALSTAFVIPDDVMSQQLIAESNNVVEASKSWLSKIPSKESIIESVQETVESAWDASENAFDAAIDAVSDVSENAKTSFRCHKSMMAFDTKEWLNSAVDSVQDIDIPSFMEHGEHPHPPHKKPHHGRPHHGHHGPPNKTVYELINSSKYTTKFAKLINKYPNLVTVLNGTSSNFTIFAPTDKAFEKIPHHHKDISDELIYQTLVYHISPYFYPAGRVLITHTIPTLKNETDLGNEAQRLRVGLGLKGLAVNFYSRIVAVDIFGTNGVIHGVDSLILPPPPTTKIIELLPGEFSTLQLAFEKTGLGKHEGEKHLRNGGTLFAPSNWAFQKLGAKVNAFLFSKYGSKYLTAILKYHLVANQTLYSDAFYNHASSVELSNESIPKGKFHIDLPTALEGKSLSVDIARWGGFIKIQINGFTTVSTQDGVAKDGVIQVLSSVLIPPKTPGEHVADEELTVEELKERLEPFVEDAQFEL